MQLLPLKAFYPHLIFFGVFIAALAPVLYYYQRRSPNPRFRPGFGEMTLVSVVALFLGGIACFLLGNVFRGEQKSPEKFNHGAGWSKDSSTSQDTGGSHSKRGKD